MMMSKIAEAKLLRSRPIRKQIDEVIETIEEIELKQFRAKIDRDMILSKLILFIQELIEASASIFYWLLSFLYR
jgi:hypothetical protein